MPLQVWLLALAMLAALAAMSPSPQRSGNEDTAATGRDVPGERLVFPRRLTEASLLVPLVLMLLWAACGGGGGPSPSKPGTPAGTYALTLTGAVGSVSRQTTVTLQVN